MYELTQKVCSLQKIMDFIICKLNLIAGEYVGLCAQIGGGVCRQRYSTTSLSTGLHHIADHHKGGVDVEDECFHLYSKCGLKLSSDAS